MVWGATDRAFLVSKYLPKHAATLKSASLLGSRHTCAPGQLQCGTELLAIVLQATGQYDSTLRRRVCVVNCSEA
eukprot:6186873-Pleurochrysis_carterae.AAC.1